MPSALATAQALLAIAAREDEPELVTNLRLQKLLYYAEGWSLAVRKSSFFPEEIEAWQHGPVVPTVYDHYAESGNQPLAAHDNAEALAPEDAAFLESLWLSYSEYSASKLRAMTHDEPPWREAMAKAAPADRPRIDRAMMTSFFSQERASRVDAEVLAKFEQAKKDFTRGEFATLHDIEARLGI